VNREAREGEKRAEIARRSFIVSTMMKQ